MQFDLNEEQSDIRNMVRQFTAQEITPHAEQWDEEQHFPREVYIKMADLGLTGMTTPEALGGGPLSLVRDGDLIRLDAHMGTLDVRLAPVIFENRGAATRATQLDGMGRELFAMMRSGADSAEAGASAMLTEAAL